ncbi:MAG: 4-hydroxy-3-methylbut-2-enyl diphosphate reductase [Bacteroidetes bacterium]|nr:4-hydroxy-3-methylbut-2-enyl diphosphate reductase [Bacteroidota bacterium]
MGRLNLHVEIDDKSGFCFGVVGAIEKAEKELLASGELFCLGEIVHNDEEVKRLEMQGMVNISKDDLSFIQKKTILFRAHGEPPESYKVALKNGNRIIDASCPIILKLQKRFRESYEKGETIYLYGKPNHPEVTGLNGQIGNKAIVFGHFEDLNLKLMPKKITLYSQTTMSIESFYDIVRELEEAGIEVTVKDTICRQVSHREPSLRQFSRKFSKIVFVAGKRSSNGSVLFNVCRQENLNTYFVSAPDEIFEHWFETGDSVGICGATSTPMWLMKNVERKLLSL